MKNNKISPEKAIERNLSDFMYEEGTDYCTYSKNAVKWFVDQCDIKNVVDLGCGDGCATDHFINFGIDAIGVDINQAKLDKVTAKTINDDRLSYLKKQNDKSLNIFTHHAIEHIPNIKEVLKEIGRVGKTIFISVPCNDSLHDVHYVAFESPEELVPDGRELYSYTVDQESQSYWVMVC